MFYHFSKKRVNRKCDFEAVLGRIIFIFRDTQHLEPMWIFSFVHATVVHHTVCGVDAVAADDDASRAW